MSDVLKIYKNHFGSELAVHGAAAFFEKNKGSRSCEYRFGFLNSILLVFFMLFFIQAKSQKFNASTGIPLDLDVGTDYVSCASPGTKKIQFTVSGLPNLLNNTTNVLNLIKLTFGECPSGSSYSMQLGAYLQSPSGKCVTIFNGGSTGGNLSTIASGVTQVGMVSSTNTCARTLNTANLNYSLSGVSNTLDATGSGGYFNTGKNLADSFININPNGTWTLYWSEASSGSNAPCVTGASLTFGNSQINDNAVNGESCVNAINYNGISMCVQTNGKDSSYNMPGWTGPGLSTFDPAFCQWNGANNNDVWIKIKAQTTGNLCINISGLSQQLQSIVVTDRNLDGDNNPCTSSTTGGTYWNTVSCPYTTSTGPIYGTTAGTTRNQTHCWSATAGTTYYLVVDGNDGVETPFYIYGDCSVPNLIITNPSAVCSPSTVNLTAAAVTSGSNLYGGTLSYWSDAAATISLANSTAITTSGTYYIKASTSPECPTVTLPVTVTVNSLPTAPTVTTPVTYCYTASASALTATASSGGTLNWYGTNATGGTASSSAPTPSTSTAGSTVYYVSQTLNGCEGPRAAITVTVTDPIVIYAHGTNPTCSNLCNGKAFVDVVGGTTPYTYTWSNGGNKDSIINLCTGTYSVIVRDANNCTSSSTPVTYSCPQIQSIQVDACYFDPNLEGYEEMVFFQNGNTTLTVSNPSFSAVWPANSWINLCTPNTTYINTANASIPSGSGGSLIPISPGGTIPANKNVVLITSNFLSSPNLSFAGLTAPLYVITQCAGNTQGHFANASASPAGTRRTIINFSASCKDTVTYFTGSLIDTTGSTGGNSGSRNGAYVNFSLSGSPSYENYGCALPYTIQSNQVVLTATTAVTPTFSFSTTVCTGAAAVPTLPTTSNNGITGTWSPTTVSNSASGTYVFTPTAGLCANTANVFITVNPCSYGTFASAVYLTKCNNNSYSTAFYNTSGTGGNIINQSANSNFTGTNLGTFVQNSGNLKLDGAEVKTYKDAGTNVCTPIMYYTIYSGTRPASPIFTPLTLNFYQNCGGTSFTSGGPCSGNDQKWQVPGSGSTSNIDLTTTAPGTYTFEVYYEIPGDISSTSLCRNVSYLNNGGANYSASFTIVASTTVSYAPLTLCTSVTSSAPTVTGITGGTYSAPAGVSINTSTGVINPSLSTPGTYTVTYNYNDAQGCPFVKQTSITINPIPAPITLTGDLICPPLSSGNVTSATSVSGVNYQLYNSSNQTVASPLSGGSSLTWSSVPVGTGYYAVGTNTTTGCSSANSNTVAVTQKTPVITSTIQTN